MWGKRVGGDECDQELTMEAEQGVRGEPSGSEEYSVKDQYG